jgi:ankyrin repeat protein
MWAAERGHTRIVRFMLECHKQALVHGKFTQDKCLINERNHGGGTALMIAINGGHLGVAHEIMTHADRTDNLMVTQNNEGWTPFLIAVRSGQFQLMLEMR